MVTIKVQTFISSFLRKFGGFHIRMYNNFFFLFFFSIFFIFYFFICTFLFVLFIQGLVIRDHVIEREILEDRSTGNEVEVEVEVEVENCRPMLVVHSLWQQACMRLLDVDTTCTDINTIDTTNLSSFSSTSTSTSTSTFSSLPSLQKSQKTWDQKFFSQIEMSESGRVAIQDMMLCVLRVAVRCLLSRSNVDSVDIVVNGEFNVFLFFYFFINSFIYLFIFLFIDLLICLFVYLFIYLLIFLFID